MAAKSQRHTVVIQFNTRADPRQIPEALTILSRGRGYVRASVGMDAREFGRLKVMLARHYPNARIRSIS